MRKLILDFDPKEFSRPIELKDKIVLLGSCFSDEMSSRFEFGGFHVLSNPFGTIFHPVILSDLINQNLSGSYCTSGMHRDDVFLSWNCSSKIHGYSIEELETNYRQAHKKLTSYFEDDSALIVTLGTSYGYVLSETNALVANCHKMPGEWFEKKLFSVEEMLESWTQTLKLFFDKYPNKKVVLTVSPVRHIKDGIIENNRSKARLIELVHKLKETFSLEYFPSYELCIDVLRDYRFYGNDLVHPNELAIDEVWNLILDTAVSKSDIELIKRIDRLKRSQQHRSLFEKSASELNRKNHVFEQSSAIKREYPFINL